MVTFFIALIVLAFPIMAIVALVVAVGANNRLQRLEHRFTSFENRLRGAAAPTAPPPPEPRAGPIERAAPTVEQPIEDVAPQPEPPGAAPPTMPPEPPASAAPRRIGFEERFGTQWVVWVGGIALALGGFFLVRYTIEQGLLGPGVRVFLGALLAAALIAAGEWTRRNEVVTGIPSLPTAHIPSILTAAGTTVAYATVYAAYALYNFLSPALAFVLLGVVALATLAAALLHGITLAGLGVVGGYLTPLLVTTEVPNYWALYLYLAIVSAAAFALARMRMWRWLAITAVVFGFIWILPGLGEGRVDGLNAHAFHALIGFALAAALIVSGFLYGPPAAAGEIDEVSSGALGAYLGAAALLVLASLHEPVAFASFTLLAAATVVIAWRTDAVVAAVPVAAALAGLVMAQWAAHPNLDLTIVRGGPGAGPEPPLADVGWHMAVGAAYAGLFGIAGFLAQGRSQRAIIPVVWSAAGVLTPIAILAALYYRVSGFDRSIPFAGLALLLAAIYAIATENLLARAPRPGLAASTAIFATGSIAALALALTLALEKGWLTIGLALMAPGVAWIAQKRPLPFLRWLAAALVVLVLVRIGYDPRIVGRDVGTTPILNWLLYGYGVPAASFWLAGHLLRRRADDVPARMADSAAILFTVLLVFFEIRHLMNHGNIFRNATGLTELALQVSAGLAMTIGLERVRARTANIVHDAGAMILAVLTFFGIVFGLAIAQNPLLTGKPVGGVFFNLVLLGYGLPAVLAIALALITRGTRPDAYRVTAAVTAVALALGYLTLQVRTSYRGPVLNIGPTTDAEQYTYSAVWLAFGVVLLLVGILLRSQPARLASAAVVILTVAKVFLVDMAGLTGVYRALSFIGLGLVLVGIGWLYQRLLFPPARPAPTASAGASSG
jgi:uncharacterized membrane protein